MKAIKGKIPGVRNGTIEVTKLLQNLDPFVFSLLYIYGNKSHLQ